MRFLPIYSIVWFHREFVNTREHIGINEPSFTLVNEVIFAYVTRCAGVAGNLPVLLFFFSVKRVLDYVSGVANSTNLKIIKEASWHVLGDVCCDGAQCGVGEPSGGVGNVLDSTLCSDVCLFHRIVAQSEIFDGLSF